jgi:hypothetical protein
LSFIKTGAEKLTTALYKITDILDDREPVKWKLREQGLVVFSNLTCAQNKSAVEATALFQGAVDEIDKLLSFLDVVFVRGFVLEMNLSIVKKEYVILKDMITEGRNSLGHFYRSNFSLAMRLQTSLPIGLESTKKETMGTFDIKDKKDIEIDSFNSKKIDENEARKNMKSAVEPHVVIPLSADKSLKQSADESKRKPKILAFLRQNGDSTIKDIMSIFTDISEKTIQRELADLTKEGTLEKRGERRWSRYIIKESL